MTILCDFCKNSNECSEYNPVCVKFTLDENRKEEFEEFSKWISNEGENNDLFKRT